ncbi:MAG: hypothetical protein Q8P31_03035 [Bacillota bacterium]|nr:hypothetical protein [Bacillota bacterium]
MPEAGAGPLDLKKTWVFFWPLALSGIIMSAGQPVVQAGLARLPSPELTLAAYGVAFHVALLLEAPIVMLLVTATALVRDERTYRFTRNATFLFCVGVVFSTGAVALWMPLYNLVFQRLLSFPADVAQAARPGLIALIPWAGAVGIRRYYQGILIRFGQTRVVSYGSMVRLATMVIAMIPGVVLLPEHGVLVGGLALLAGVVADMLVALFFARRLLMQHVLPAVSDEATDAGLKVMPFLAFFTPLILTTALRFVGRPLMLSGIARSHEPVLALAAFPVALGTLQMFSGFVQMLQNVGVALVKDAQSFAVVRRFALIVTAVCTGLVALVAFTPLGNLYHGVAIGLEGPALAMANVSLRLIVLAAGLTALLSYLQGLMIRRGRTVAVNAAALGNVILLVAAVNLVAINTSWPGHLIAGVIFPLALVVEVGILYVWCRPIAREITAAAPAAAAQQRRAEAAG